MSLPLGVRFALSLPLLTGLAILPTFADEQPGRDEIVRLVRELGPRRENTDGERRLFTFLVSEAEKLSLPLTSIPIADYSDTHSFSRILEVRVPGTGSGNLALVFPLTDSLEWGDGAEGIAAALELWDRFSRSTPPVTVRFAFLGADENNEGSRAYAAYCADETALAVLRAEIDNDSFDTAELIIGGRGVLSPYWLLDAGVRAVRDAGRRDIVRANRSLLQRLGLLGGETPLDPWFRRGIPAIAIRAGANSSSGSAVTLIENLVRSLDSGIPDRWDRQYLLFEAAGARLVIRETPFVLLVLGVYAALGLVFVLDSLRRRDLIPDELSRVPAAAAALAVVFLALFLCVLAAGAFQQLVLWLSGSPDFWKIHPVAFSMLRIGQLLTLFLFLASFCARIGLLPRRAEFFRGSAIFVLGADVLLVSAVRLPLSLLFLWAFVLAILGRRLSRQSGSLWPAALSLPIVIAPLAFLAGELIRAPDLPAFEGFLLPGLGGTAYFGFLSLPFLLLLVGLGEGLFGSGFYKVRTATLSGLAFLVLSLGGGLWLITDAREFTGDTDIEIHEYVSEDSGYLLMEAISSRPLPAFRLDRGRVRAEFTGGKSTESFESSLFVPLLSVSIAREYFLDRTQLNLSVSADGDVDGIRVRIPSFDSGSVFDSSFPFRSTDDGKGIEVFIGARPPRPVTVSLTVSRDFSAAATVVVEYRSPVGSFLPEGRVRILNYKAEYRTEVFLKGERTKGS